MAPWLLARFLAILPLCLVPFLQTCMAWAGKCPAPLFPSQSVPPPPPPRPIYYETFDTNATVLHVPEGVLFLPQNLETPKPGPRRPRRVVINYAQGCCNISQHRNCFTALKYGADMCLAYNASVLSPTFKRHNNHTLSLHRGGGYWIWKPYVILKTLMRLDWGDIVLYSDAAQDFIDDIVPFFEDKAVMGEKAVFLGWGQIWHNGQWTKNDTFQLLGCTDIQKCRHGTQIQASLMAFRKSEAGLGFAAKWLAYAEDPRALTDMPSTLGQNWKSFRDHRHDQSIVSLLAILYELEPVYALHDWIQMLEFNCTVWHHRIRR